MAVREETITFTQQVIEVPISENRKILRYSYTMIFTGIVLIVFAVVAGTLFHGLPEWIEITATITGFANVSGGIIYLYVAEKGLRNKCGWDGKSPYRVEEVA